MVSYPSSIVAAFLGHAARTPDKPCLLFEEESWSYARMRTEGLRWAGAYRAAGVRPGDRVALCLENSPSFVTAYLGAHLAGAIVVPVNTQYRQVELRHILSDAAVRLCVTDVPRRAELARVRDDLPELGLVVTVEVDDGRFLIHADPFEPTPPDAEDVALIGYTSGTTGRAKGAMLSHRNLAANAWAVTTAWGWTADDRLLLTLPLFHAHGLCVGLNGTLLVGATVDLRRKFEAAEVLDGLIEGEATMFFGVPTMYGRLIAEAERRGSVPRRLRLYVSGSAPLNVQTFADFERLFGQRILERYGMTETIMNLTNPLHGERRPGTVGVPFPGQEARIVDVQTRQPIEDERPGEIQVRGPHVFKGYWRNPEATAEVFDPEGWFNTGDLGWRSHDGYYTISGRARELIISGGFNVYPREVEDVLEGHPAVAEAAVLGLPDPDLGEQVAAAVVLSGPASEEELIAHCRDQLASYKKPRQLFFVESLPRNALGKVQKHVLKEQLAPDR